MKRCLSGSYLTWADRFLPCRLPTAQPAMWILARAELIGQPGAAREGGIMRASHFLNALSCVVACLALSMGASSAQQAAAPVAIDVAATKVQVTDWTEKVSTVGIAEARQGVDVSIS